LIEIPDVRRAIEKGGLRAGTHPRHTVTIMFILHEGLCATTQVGKIISSIKDIGNVMPPLRPPDRIVTKD
jgi:hypothetical protein